MKITDMTGQRYGKLTVLSFSHTKGSRAHWFVKCDCGAEKTASGKHLRSGQVISCGCQRGTKPTYESEQAQKKAYRERYPEKSSEYTRRYRERNAEKVAMSRRAASVLQRSKRRLLKSVPVWADKAKIKTVYEKAAQLCFEVDHVVPIVSDSVCGLHVWENLQLLEATLNRRKSNKYWPDMPDNKRLPNATLQSLTR